ncbi:MAG: hypothetical protein ACYDB7_03310 [Mycobacteriales bacterium]
MGIGAVVMCWVPVVLGADRYATAAEQWYLGGATWLLLLLLLRREDGLTRAQVAVVVVYATLVEYTFSASLHVYTYSLHGVFPFVPSFVPPGHGLVYLAALSIARDPWVRRHGRSLLRFTLLAVGGYAVWGVTLSGRPDVLGLLWFAALVWFARRSRQPLVYVGAALVVTWLELLGTHLGVWTWSMHDPTGFVPIGNPPSGAAGGYGFFDAAALALGPWVLGRARALKSRQWGEPVLQA